MNLYRVLIQGAPGPKYLEDSTFRRNSRFYTDTGYAAHRWLVERFGEHAPKPFAITNVGIEAYTELSPEELEATSPTPIFSPGDRERAIFGRNVPALEPGTLLQVSGRVACTVRAKGRERSIFASTNGCFDADVARGWLAEKLEGAGMEPLGVRVLYHDLYKVVRRRSDERHVGEVPFLEFEALLRVPGSQMLLAMLARGLERSRAFGFGLLDIRPPS